MRACETCSATRLCGSWRRCPGNRRRKLHRIQRISMVDAINAIAERKCAASLAAAYSSQPGQPGIGGLHGGLQPTAGSTLARAAPSFRPTRARRAIPARASSAISPTPMSATTAWEKLTTTSTTRTPLNGLFIIGNYVGSGEDHPFVTTAFLDQFPDQELYGLRHWDYTPNSTMVNEVRFGYNRMEYSITSQRSGHLGSHQYGLDVATGLPNLYITGFNFLGTWHNRPQTNSPNPYYDFQDASRT